MAKKKHRLFNRKPRLLASINKQLGVNVDVRDPKVRLLMWACFLMTLLVGLSALLVRLFSLNVSSPAKPFEGLAGLQLFAEMKQKAVWLLGLFQAFFVGNGELITPLCATTCQHSTTVFGFHASAEAVFVSAFATRRLVGTFHGLGERIKSMF